MVRPFKCPYCGSTSNQSKGFRYNKAGAVRLRRCNSCGRKWTVGGVPVEQSPQVAPVQEESSRYVSDGNAQMTERNEKELSRNAVGIREEGKVERSV